MPDDDTTTAAATADTSTAVAVTEASQIPPHNGTSTSDHTDTLTSDDTSSFSYQRNDILQSVLSSSVNFLIPLSIYMSCS